MFSGDSHVANSIKQGTRLVCLPGGAGSSKLLWFCDSESGFPKLLPPGHLTGLLVQLQASRLLKGKRASQSFTFVPQVTGLLVDESSFTGEVEPCSKTDSPLVASGDLSTLSNVVFMGTLVQCGKGQVSRVRGAGPAAPGPVLPPSLFHTGSCDRNRGTVSVWRSVQDDAGRRGEGSGARGGHCFHQGCSKPGSGPQEIGAGFVFLI